MKTMDKQRELDKVAEDIARREVCLSLSKNCTNPVPGDGSPDADIMFIGEAPGKQEDLEGKPFVGAAGKFLAEMLEGIKLTRDDVYITNIVKYRPPENRDPTPEEIKECLPFLVRQIKIIQPKLIVLLGRHAMNVFFPNFRISQVHGKPVRMKNQVYMPLFHPAAALYNGSMRETLIEDFNKIPQILEKINSN